MTSRVKRSQLLAISLVLANSAYLPTFADTASTTTTAGPTITPATTSAVSTTTPASTTTTSITTTTKAPLEGGVQKVQLSLEQLRDAGLDLKNLLKAITSLYDEVTIQPVSMVMEPEVVGRGMVISIPVATQAIGPPQPPKKSRVDQAMLGIKPSITTMKSNLDAFASGKEELDLPTDLLQKMTPQIKEWSAVVDDLSARLAQLETLTAGPTYDNAAIAAETTAMQKDVKDLDETRRAVYKEVRDEGKHKHKF